MKICPVIDKAIPLAEEWVNEVRIIAENTAPPTIGTTFEANGRPYVIVVPQREGVSDHEWVRTIERKMLAVKGPQ